MNLESTKIEWSGNLNDDCHAVWCGLNLHAEEMDRNYWWWQVTDANHEIIDTSNHYETKYKNGKNARKAAEKVAMAYAASSHAT